MRGRNPAFRRHRRSGVSEVIAILLLVIIVVAFVSIVLLFGTGVIRQLQSGGTSTPVTATGQMIVPGASGDQAVVSLSLRNSDNLPIVSVSVTCPASYFTTASGNSCFAVTYNNIIVSAVNPLPLESTALGSAAISSNTGVPFASGQTYSLLLAIQFASGAKETVDVEVTAIT